MLAAAELKDARHNTRNNNDNGRSIVIMTDRCEHRVEIEGEGRKRRRTGLWCRCLIISRSIFAIKCSPMLLQFDKSQVERDQKQNKKVELKGGDAAAAAAAADVGCCCCLNSHQHTTMRPPHSTSQQRVQCHDTVQRDDNDQSGSASHHLLLLLLLLLHRKQHTLLSELLLHVHQPSSHSHSVVVAATIDDGEDDDPVPKGHDETTKSGRLVGPIGQSRRSLPNVVDTAMNGFQSLLQPSHGQNGDLLLIRLSTQKAIATQNEIK